MNNIFDKDDITIHIVNDFFDKHKVLLGNKENINIFSSENYAKTISFHFRYLDDNTTNELDNLFKSNLTSFFSIKVLILVNNNRLPGEYYINDIKFDNLENSKIEYLEFTKADYRDEYDYIFI